ncbi:MAG: hypothetical protein AN483_20180 [Aphanizomenon flos-aquae MDT14a]|nr:MAG: hypothetical protein AN483_20180 [Aphanizomenon flos-aquae MDT14a]
MENTLVDKTFRDSNGRIVLAQMPNLPLIVWIVASLLALFFTNGKINTVLVYPLNISGKELFKHP